VNDYVFNATADLAEVQRQLGEYQQSKDLLSAIIQTALQAGMPESANKGKAYLGRVLKEEGDLVDAQHLTEEVVDYGTRAWLDNPVSIYNTLLELGAIYQAQGDLGAAEATYAEAHDGLLNLFGPVHPSTLVAASNLGQLYESIGLYDKAEPILKQTLAIFEENFGPAHPDTMRVRNNLALLHESQGNFREAEPLYERSLDLMSEVHGVDHTDTIAVRNNLAFLNMLMEEYDTSATMFRQVMDQWTILFGPDHQNTLKATNNLGRVLQKLGELEEAEMMISQALDLRRQVLGERHPDAIRSMIDLGGVYIDEARLAEADALLTDALAIAEQTLGEQHPYTFEALNMLAAAKEAQDKLEAAIDLRDEGMRRRSRFLDTMLWTTGENAREGYIRLHRPELDAYLALIARVGGEEAGKRVIDASLQRKGLLLKITSEIQQIATMAKDPSLRKVADQLEATRKRLAALTLSGPTAETADNHAEVLYRLEQEVNELQGQMGRASVRFRTSIAAVSSDTVETVLTDGQALVDFIYYNEDGEQKLLAGVMINEGGDIRYEIVPFDDREAIEAAVTEYRTIIQDQFADEDEMHDIGMNAYELIWAPVNEVLDGIEYVYLIPDGILNILPFNALMNEDEEYLLQTHDLHILTSGRDIIPNEFQLANGEYVILAGPDYNSDDVVSDEQKQEAIGRRSSTLQLGIRGAGSGLRGLNFAPLPGAEEEGRIITDQVQQNDHENEVFFGRAAEEIVLTELAEPPEILHVATHGFFLKADDNLRKRLLKLQRGADLHVPPPGDNPLLRAGLAFAGINANAQFLGDIDTVNDGVLTALEVLGLNLSGTKLVVLSACETGLGEIHEGEGVYGLRRSFQEAGVAEVISSLWEVSDAGTQALMTGFYDRMLAGQPAREALRDAQLDMLESPEWGFPYVWSAFMIVGSYESAGFSVQ
ncbi:MAG: CHAT domain-containing protein, partial [Pseudomonadales bacterium]|nr:CHAT domain-containing protein [Pseudomonadales bacterium]